MDWLFRPFFGSGLIMENNEIYLLWGGVYPELWASRVLTIRNNTFYLAPGIDESRLFLTGSDIKQRLGGKFINEKYVEPGGEGSGKPIIEDNKIIRPARADRRNWNLVDLRQLDREIARVGEEACIRPRYPPTNLRAKVAGAGVVRLTWEPSKDPSVIGYIVRYGPHPKCYLNPTFVKGNSAVIKGLRPGRYYFTVSAHKSVFVECWKLSNEVEVAIGEGRR